MTTGRTTLTFVLLGASCALGGCAQPGPIQSYRTNVSSLKTSVSHLEYENEQLRKQVAELDSKNREIGDQLVQVEATRDELASRLDDTRNEMRRNGFDPGEEPSAPDANETKPRRTLPAGRASTRKRKPPYARIPGRIESLTPADDDPDEDAAPSPSGVRQEFGSQSRYSSDHQWLPVARAPGFESTHSR